MRLRSSPSPLPRLLSPPLDCFTPRIGSPLLSTLSPPLLVPRRLSATATPSPSSAPEPSIRLFARNRFHVFGPLLHLYKRARTTNIGHCARDVMDASRPMGPVLRPYPSSLVFLVPRPQLHCCSVDSADFCGDLPNSTEFRTSAHNRYSSITLFTIV